MAIAIIKDGSKILLRKVDPAKTPWMLYSALLQAALRQKTIMSNSNGLMYLILTNIR